MNQYVGTATPPDPIYVRAEAALESLIFFFLELMDNQGSKLFVCLVLY